MAKKTSLLICIVPLIFYSCMGESGIREFAAERDGAETSFPEASYFPPIANAGPDRVIVPGEKSSLYAEMSSGSAPSSFSYFWEQTDGPSVILSNASSEVPTFVAPLQETILRFNLTVRDGCFASHDSVQLVVNSNLSLRAPSLRLGPDRLNSLGDSLLSDDVVQLSPSAAALTSQRIAFDEDGCENDGSLPMVIRAEASAEGLSSAPDHIAIFNENAKLQGQQAPLATIDGPEAILHRTTFVLSAKKSTDVNGDALRYRWEQVSGPRVENPVGRYTQEFSATVPAGARELVFRLHVRDSTLHSAPAELSLIIAGSSSSEMAFDIPTSLSLFVHGGNEIWLDGLVGIEALEDYANQVDWSQTTGAPLLSMSSESSRFLSVTTDTISSEWAFRAEQYLDEQLQNTSVYSVYRINEFTNKPPYLSVCGIPSVLRPGQGIEVLIVANDPEFDALGDIHIAMPNGASLSPTNSAANVSGDANCFLAAEALTELPNSAFRQVFFLNFDESIAGGTEEFNGDFSIQICDALGACSENEFSVDVLVDNPEP